MIIRTSVRNDRALAKSRAHLSQREQRRLENTKHPEGKRDAFAAEVTEAPVEVQIVPFKEEIPVREENLQEITESAVPAPAIVEPETTNIRPGTAVVRSKVLDEIANKYRQEPQEKPKKKYKVISIGDNKK